MDAAAGLLEFLQFTLGHLVKEPELAAIRSDHREDGSLVFRVKVSPEDYGRVVGVKGHTVAAIRSILTAGAARHNLTAVLKIEERAAPSSS